MAKRQWRRISAEEKEWIWAGVKRGESCHEIGRGLDRDPGTVAYVVRERGGVPPRWRRSERRLSLAEREEISRGLVEDSSLRCIAGGLGRSPSTISREVAAGGGRRRYRAWAAERAAFRRAQRPKAAKLVDRPALRVEVEAKLEAWWSPQQISAWLKETYPDQPEMQVSHETIYQSLFVQGRGALRKELVGCLRSGRAARRPRSRHQASNKLKDMVMISERPAEVADRAVPGHWEGDLIVGKAGHSAVGTLVERSTRYVMLLRLEAQTAQAVREAMTRQILTLPASLRRSLTWDQGREMAEHVRFSLDTDVAVYFCDPHSPWQRGSNENTNGLLRQYMPRGMDLSGHSQSDLDAMADSLNGRPRQTLGWRPPSQALAEFVACTA
ncbi:MAG TPA: IS30 family transposase [Acidimicrobiales bacterium]